jgi:beta-mannosidase
VNGKVESAPADSKVVIQLTDPNGEKKLDTEAILSKEGSFSTKLEVSGDLQLWYPFTYGSSPLYTLTAILPDHDKKSQKLGLRRLRLLQHELKNEPGTSFVFEINNVRVFAGGSCWIPGDYLLPRFTHERYEEWLLLAKAGNQAMVRLNLLYIRFLILC